MSLTTWVGFPLGLVLVLTLAGTNLSDDGPTPVHDPAPTVDPASPPAEHVFAASDQEEIKKTIEDAFAYTRKYLKTNTEDYSKLGALEFWSSGGLLHEIRGSGRPETYESFNLSAKHIKVVVLVEGQAAIAHYYSEGSAKPTRSPLISHYLTRVTQAFSKEDGKWRIRSSHWSALTGGSGTTQTGQSTEK